MTSFYFDKFLCRRNGNHTKECSLYLSDNCFYGTNRQAMRYSCRACTEKMGVSATVPQYNETHTYSKIIVITLPFQSNNRHRGSDGAHSASSPCAKKRRYTGSRRGRHKRDRLFSHVEKGEIRIFLGKPHVESAGFEPGTHAAA